MSKTQILRFEYDNSKYRVIAEVINDMGDLNTYVEKYMYNAKATESEPEHEVWLKVTPDAASEMKLSMLQLVEILETSSAFVNENYYFMMPERRRHVCREPCE